MGVPRESSTLSVFRFGSNSGTQVYLGLENSAPCGGYLRNYTICYYNTRTGRPVTPGQLSMWETGTTSNGLRVCDKVYELMAALRTIYNNFTNIRLFSVA